MFPLFSVPEFIQNSFTARSKLMNFWNQIGTTGRIGEGLGNGIVVFRTDLCCSDFVVAPDCQNERNEQK